MVDHDETVDKEEPTVGGNGGGVVEGEDDSDTGQTLSTLTSLPSVLPQTGVGPLLATIVLAVAVAVPTYILTRKFE